MPVKGLGNITLTIICFSYQYAEPIVQTLHVNGSYIMYILKTHVVMKVSHICTSIYDTRVIERPYFINKL